MVGEGRERQLGIDEGIANDLDDLPDGGPDSPVDHAFTNYQMTVPGSVFSRGGFEPDLANAFPADKVGSGNRKLGRFGHKSSFDFSSNFWQVLSNYTVLKSQGIIRSKPTQERSKRTKEGRDQKRMAAEQELENIFSSNDHVLVEQVLSLQNESAGPTPYTEKYKWQDLLSRNSKPIGCPDNYKELGKQGDEVQPAERHHGRRARGGAGRGRGGQRPQRRTRG